MLNRIISGINFDGSFIYGKVLDKVKGLDGADSYLIEVLTVYSQVKNTDYIPCTNVYYVYPVETKITDLKNIKDVVEK